MTDAVTQPPGPADLAEIYYAPSDVFERRRNGGFGLPLAVLVIAMAVLYYATIAVMGPVMDAEWDRMAAGMARQNPEITPEALAQGRGIAETFAIVGIFFTALLGPLFAGLLIWLVGKFAGVKQTLTAAMTVAVFSFYPLLVEQIVSAAQAAVLSEDSITSRFSLSVGPARFLDGASFTTLSLIGHIDVFTIWMAVLIGIGVKVTARATTAQAVIVAVVMWLIGVLPALWGALSSQA